VHHLVASLVDRKVNYARRQQIRRLIRAGEAAAGAAIALVLGVAAAAVGAAAAGVVLFLAALALGFYARHSLDLARRSHVGARSEDIVRHVLASLRAEGWQLRHSLQWQGRGDIDSVAIAPTRIAIAIETKTRTYRDEHVARVWEQAAWLSRRRRRWARNGVLAVICLVRARGVERVEGDVLILSMDRLLHVLRLAASIGPSARSAAQPGMPRRPFEFERRR
jgi:Nuclease-related domain